MNGEPLRIDGNRQNKLVASIIKVLLGRPVLSEKKAEYFKRLLESRISELNRVLAAAEQETRASATRHADPADQAAAEYERQLDPQDRHVAWRLPASPAPQRRARGLTPKCGFQEVA